MNDRPRMVINFGNRPSLASARTLLQISHTGLLFRLACFMGFLPLPGLEKACRPPDK